MSGSSWYTPEPEKWHYPSGSVQIIHTGTVGAWREPLYRELIDPDELWRRMYEEPRPVIFVCGYCKSHNALGNPTCVQCGAPLGYAKQR